MTDRDASDTEVMQVGGGELEAEAQALVETFNDANPDYGPELEWFAMSTDSDTGDQSFVFEASRYIDPDGLSALRESGRHVRYIEAYEYQGEVKVQIHIPVKGGVQG